MERDDRREERRDERELQCDDGGWVANELLRCSTDAKEKLAKLGVEELLCDGLQYA